MRKTFNESNGLISNTFNTQSLGSHSDSQAFPWSKYEKSPDQLGVTRSGEVVKNHGWAGHTVEWLLGSSPNNQQAATFEGRT